LDVDTDLPENDSQRSPVLEQQPSTSILSQHPSGGQCRRIASDGEMPGSLGARIGGRMLQSA